MDRRDEELKVFRRAYKRDKRKATAFWKFLTLVSVVAFLVLLLPGLQAMLPGTVFGSGLVFLGQWVPEVQSAGNVLVEFCGIYLPVFWGIALMILVLSVVMWSMGSRKMRKNEAYLSYRTLQAALKEEKKYQV